MLDPVNRPWSSAGAFSRCEVRELQPAEGKISFQYGHLRSVNAVLSTDGVRTVRTRGSFSGRWMQRMAMTYATKSNVRPVAG